MRLWRTSDGTPLGDPLLQSTNSVFSLRFNSDGTRLAAGDADGAVHLWNPESREPVLEEPIQTGQVYVLGN